jgi:hypothetical protein
VLHLPSVQNVLKGSSFMIRRLFTKFAGLPPSDRWYGLAFGLALLGVVRAGIAGYWDAAFYFMLPAGVACSIGLALWVWPWLRRMWQSSGGKLAVTLLHGLVLLLSVIPARELVASALGVATCKQSHAGLQTSAVFSSHSAQTRDLASPHSLRMSPHSLQTACKQ